MMPKSRSVKLEISAYWNALVAHEEPLPPMSDAELAQLIDSIQRSDDSEAPSTDFTDGLFRSISAAQPWSQSGPLNAPIPLASRTERARSIPSEPAWSRRALWLAVAALLVAIIVLSQARWRNEPEEPPAIPAAMPASESVAPEETRPMMNTLAQLMVDPDQFSPGARETWTAASFRLFEIPAGSYYELPVCRECAVLVIVTVTEGTMDLQVDGPVAVSDQANGAVHQSTPGQSIPLSGGTSAVFDLQSATGYRSLANNGDEPATLLVGFVYSDDFRIAAGGGTPPRLYSSLWTLPSLGDGTLTLEIDRIDVEPGEVLQGEGAAQSALYLLDQGTLTVAADDNTGAPISWQAPVGVQLDQLPAGTYELANEGPDAAVLYRLTLSITPTSSNDPALED